MNQAFNPQFAKIGEILVNNGKATESGINEALAQQKTTNEKIGTTLIEMGLIEEDDFTTAYSQQLGYKKADNFILLEADSQVAALIPEISQGRIVYWELVATIQQLLWQWRIPMMWCLLTQSRD